jgi:uncharacterized Rmd1/YagE family protein
MQKQYFSSLGHPTEASNESNRQQQATPPQSSHHFTLRASYLGSDIDINATSLKPMLRSRSLYLGRDYCVFTLKPSRQMTPPADHDMTPHASSTASTEAFSPSGSGSGSGLGLGAAGDEEMLLDEAKRHGICVAFKFGSVVFVVPRSKESQAPTLTSPPSSQDHHHSDLFNSAHASPSASEERAAAEERACELLQGNLASILRPPNMEVMGAASLSDCVGVEEAHLVVRPSMKRDFAKEKDRVAVPDLDIGNLEVICRVLGQSAALDFYTQATEQQVEALDVVLAELASNAGKPFYVRPLLFRRLRGGKLLSRIASSSIVYNKVVSKLGLLDTSRTAWESHTHDIVWQGLRQEYELTERFENLLKRLDIFKEESRFILDVRNERAGTLAEITIIVLISIEIVIQIYTHFIV